MITPSLKRSSQVVLALGCASSGAAAALTLVSATTGTYNESPSWHVLYDSTPAVQAAGAAVAVLMASLRLSSTTRILTALIATIVLVSTLAGTTGDSILLGYVTSILAGVILGGVAGWSLAVAPRLDWAPAALAVGTVIGVVLREPLSDPFILYPGGNGPMSAISVESVTTALLLLSVMLAAVLNPAVGQALSPVSEPVSEPGTASRSGRLTLAAGCGLAIMSVLVTWWYTATVHSDAAMVDEWYPAYGQVALILVIAVIVGSRGGALLVVAAAWTISRSGETNWVPDSRWWLLLVVVGVIAGALLGWRHGRPVVGITVLAVCAATYLLIDAPFIEVYSGAALFVAPGATAFSMAGLLRGTRPAAALLAIALAAPAVWMFAPRAVFIDITTIGSADPGPRSIDYAFVSPSLEVAAKVAVPMIVAIAACVAVLLVIQRRGNEPSQ
ncbi:hypothetical protein [Williamsia maris]|uniref:Uncharacterized protein n=1 Tax=Williamsia maris TaxID=72806 RepID=A0ABT1HD42_9NOCA|nr:hypothetical protein [Williamsia maris]MCP2176173.1 hypothetical protein [Williamsia maris]